MCFILLLATGPQLQPRFKLALRNRDLPEGLIWEEQILFLTQTSAQSSLNSHVAFIIINFVSYQMNYLTLPVSS